MYRTVASTMEIGGTMEVNFDLKGNQYIVALVNKDTDEYTFKTFDTMTDALAVYQRFVEAFITGCYSYEDRKSWLQKSEDL